MAIDEGIVNMRANDGVVELRGNCAQAFFGGNDVPRRLRLLAAMTGARSHLSEAFEQLGCSK